MPSLRLIRALARPLLVACTFAAIVVPAMAQQPSSSAPLRIIVPYAPGGALDAFMRRIGPAITESTGRSVVVDNRPGGNTNIGMAACQAAAPDGNTVCFTVEDSIVYNPLLFRKLPYDPASLVPVIYLARGQAVLVASGAAPFGNVDEMVRAAKAKPTGLNFGTWGPGTTPDLFRGWIAHSKGIRFTAVPYKGVGGGGTMQAVMTGEIDMSIFTIGQILPQIKDGKVKPIAVSGKKRWPGLPNVPTMAEADMDPGLVPAWAVYAPPGTPAAVVQKLNADFAHALKAPSVKEFLATTTLEAVGDSPAELSKALDELRISARRLFTILDIKPVDSPN